VRMVFAAKDQYDSYWEAIVSIAGNIGCTAGILSFMTPLTRQNP
jgi:hypothetical protein